MDYLPQASHQVIVLSTDTEVDEELFGALRPHLSHAYRLTYLPDDRRTRVDGGYFWSARKEEPCPT
jgi:DNA sulfur modification protein DndD